MAIAAAPGTSPQSPMATVLSGVAKLVTFLMVTLPANIAVSTIARSTQMAMLTALVLTGEDKNIKQFMKGGDILSDVAQMTNDGMLKINLGLFREYAMDVAKLAGIDPNHAADLASHFIQGAKSGSSSIGSLHFTTQTEVVSDNTNQRNDEMQTSLAN